MVEFVAIIQKFGEKGKKTGWSYIEVPMNIANEINKGAKKSFRVKGYLDSYPLVQVALVPMGEGDFILALNAETRKGIRKEVGAQLQVSLEFDTSKITIDQDFLDCLENEPKAKQQFNTLPEGHKKYFSNWISSAKTLETKTKRINQVLFGLANQMDYGQMIRHFKAQKEKLS
jgi:hypothetical protein